MDKKEVPENLGLGAGSALPVGVPVPWPTETPPAGWLKCNGAAFDKAKYPGLALAYPSGKLPDLRGEFVRGWDDGREVDAGRRVQSTQQATGLRTAAIDYFGWDETTSGGTIGTAFMSADSFTTAQPANAMSPDGGRELMSIMTDNSMRAEQLPTGLANPYAVWITVRPRNVAFNYIVRAA